MEEYLVESHLGGYYISSLEPRKIEATCEQCFDSDMIVAAWEKDNQKEKIETITNYFCGKEINEQIYTDYLDYTELDNQMDIEEDINETFTDFIVIISNLKECGYLNDVDAEFIKEDIMLKKQEWLDFSKNYHYCKVLTR